MKKIKLGVIFGGESTEHNISIISGTSVIKNLNKDKYDITPIYISKNGKWFKYIKNQNDIDILDKEELEEDLIVIDNIEKMLKKLDIVFPVLHGINGEDGTIQGLLEIMKIPYVGCKVLSSSICMDKVYTKYILDRANINQVKYMYIKKCGKEYVYIDENLDERKIKIKDVCELAIEKLGFPLFIKPSKQGSSIGISKVNNKKELINGINNASKYDSKIIIEKGIDAIELECAALGNGDVDISCVGEIIKVDEFYSYDAKYKSDKSKTIIPANIDNKQIEIIRNIAKKVFKVLDCNVLARIDFFIDKTSKEIYVNEINTMPGFTNISMYPKLWENSGYKYDELLDKLIELSIE